MEDDEEIDSDEADGIDEDEEIDSDEAEGDGDDDDEPAPPKNNKAERKQVRGAERDSADAGGGSRVVEDRRFGIYDARRYRSEAENDAEAAAQAAKGGGKNASGVSADAAPARGIRKQPRRPRTRITRFGMKRRAVPRRARRARLRKRRRLARLPRPPRLGPCVALRKRATRRASPSVVRSPVQPPGPPSDNTS